MRVELDGDNSYGITAVEDDDALSVMAVVEGLSAPLTDEELSALIEVVQ